MNDLTTRVRNGLQDGRLPRTDCLVAWFGPGRGEICVVCAARILGSEIAVECDLTDGRSLWFHSRCYDVWLSVRRGLAPGAPAGL
jgi:hypothetical protein